MTNSKRSSTTHSFAIQAIALSAGVAPSLGARRENLIWHFIPWYKSNERRLFGNGWRSSVKRRKLTKMMFRGDIFSNGLWLCQFQVTIDVIWQLQIWNKFSFQIFNNLKILTHFSVICNGLLCSFHYHAINIKICDFVYWNKNSVLHCTYHTIALKKGKLKIHYKVTFGIESWYLPKTAYLNVYARTCMLFISGPK